MKKRRTPAPKKHPNLFVLSLLLLGSLMVAFTSSAKENKTPKVPSFDHIVVVIMENHSFETIIGNPAAPYINSLALSGANMTNSFGLEHMSQPNYFALFSGSTQGITDNAIYNFKAPTVAGQLASSHEKFIGYAEAGAPRKHTPWLSFKESVKTGADFTAFPATEKGFRKLPLLSFVIPDENHNMHDGSIEEGDAWLKTHMDAYAQWAKAHNSLLILTWDEDNDDANNHIPTIIVGAKVKAGNYSEYINHYNVLRTIQASLDLPPLEETASVQIINDIWNKKANAKQDNNVEE